jgi:Co/Zn/Cd efflux system component
MADCCCTPPPLDLDRNRGNAGYRRALWAVLGINTVMFLVEIGAGLATGSASLQADATLPSAVTMGAVGLAALTANAASFGLL